MKPKMRVVDIPAGVTAEVAEQLLNAPCDDGYYQFNMTHSGLPDGVTARVFYRLRVKPE